MNGHRRHASSPGSTALRQQAESLVETRSTFDEEKCRNVLVRYCAHVPRNYRYRDGIRRVFLVLRDHFGDEHLGRAGGVLYEMIEVDCQHSDDPGAAFQRWRHDHMNRHADLELPHIPHLTTITSAIVPTSDLTEWRRRHPERYQTRLSDYSPKHRRNQTLPGCIRNRKSWLIDHTMYVTSWNNGTEPLRRIKPKEFHELQWTWEESQTGSVVDASARAVIEVQDDMGSQDHLMPAGPHRKFRSKIWNRAKSIQRFFGSSVERRKESIGDDSATTFTASSAMCKNKTTEACMEKQPPTPATQVEVCQCEIPNANFARKFGLLAENDTVLPFIGELPVAEDKVADVEKERERAQKRFSGFQGPFTPQLWFDGGLDFRWRRI